MPPSKRLNLFLKHRYLHHKHCLYHTWRGRTPLCRGCSSTLIGSGTGWDCTRLSADVEKSVDKHPVQMTSIPNCISFIHNMSGTFVSYLRKLKTFYLVVSITDNTVAVISIGNLPFWAVMKYFYLTGEYAAAKIFLDFPSHYEYPFQFNVMLI